VATLAEVFALAQQHHQAGALQPAVAIYRQILQANPAHSPTLFYLGAAYQTLRDLPAATDCYRRLLLLEPANAEVHYQLGLTLHKQGNLADAATSYEQSLRLRPHYAEAHNNLSGILLELGRPEEALAHSLEALRLLPDCAPALFNLAELAVHGHYQFPPDQVRRIETLLANPSLSLNDGSLLHFALALLRDKAGAQEAFDSYRQGNALKRRHLHETGQAFDPREHRESIQQLIDVCGPEFFRRTEGFGLDSELPVFIVGMPRSGTTLVEQILSRHPRVFGAGELKEVGRLVVGLPSRLHASEGYPRCLERLDRDIARELAETYLQHLTRRSASAARVTDKMPLNYLHLGLLAVLFPRARVIHCRRDPRDVCLSCYFQYFRELNFTWDLDDLGRYYRTYEWLMARWNAVLPVKPLEVVYEELVADQEAVSRRLVDFCGLEWDDRCLSFQENRRPVQTMSKLQVRRPIYTTSVGRWQRYQEHLGPLLEALQADPSQDRQQRLSLP
jgi:tetratricopeptide (TPR) repeat protein